MYEHRTERLIPLMAFLLRLARTGAIAAGIIAMALGIGIAGYRRFEHMDWIDATLNAAMILSGMGPVSPLRSDAGKMFAAAYAIFSGVLFLSVAAVLFAPVFHRIIHRFHLQLGDDDRIDGR